MTDFVNHKYMISYYISFLYFVMRIYGFPVYLQPILYISTWLTIIVGFPWLLLRKIKNKPIPSYVWYKITNTKSDLPLLIIKIMIAIDLLRNPVNINIIDLLVTMILTSIYFLLIGFKIYII